MWDGATLESAVRGCREARGVLLCALQDPWYRLCLSLLGDVERATDATQETAVRFLKQISGFRGESQLRTWSMGIALNVVREMRRKRVRETPAGEDGLAAIDASGVPTPARLGLDRPLSPDDEAEHSEDRRRLLESLAQLPDRQREALVLRFLEDLSVEQTADIMGCAEGTVKATVHQALKSMRNRMEKASV
jgi:RNA polymerase sigma-70 factor (ECF subfamily)